jgi:hypothetical protein
MLSGVVLLMFVLGIVAVTRGADMLRQASDISARGESVAGLVVARGSEAGGGPGTGKVEKMTVEYTVGGVRYRIRVTGDKPVGSGVEVRYDPADPGRPVTSLTQHRISAVLGIFIGLGLALGPSGLTLKLTWEARQERRKHARAGGGRP